jgi:hypothetical protein
MKFSLLLFSVVLSVGVRQLEPQMHIDSNPSVIVDLERFIQRLVYIGSSACSSSSRTNRPIVSLEKLEDIFL